MQHLKNRQPSSMSSSEKWWCETFYHILSDGIVDETASLLDSASAARLIPRLAQFIRTRLPPSRPGLHSI